MEQYESTYSNDSFVNKINSYLINSYLFIHLYSVTIYSQNNFDDFVFSEYKSNNIKVSK